MKKPVLLELDFQEKWTNLLVKYREVSYVFAVERRNPSCRRGDSLKKVNNWWFFPLLLFLKQLNILKQVLLSPVKTMAVLPSSDPGTQLGEEFIVQYDWNRALENGCIDWSKDNGWTCWCTSALWRYFAFWVTSLKKLVNCKKFSRRSNFYPRSSWKNFSIWISRQYWMLDTPPLTLVPTRWFNVLVWSVWRFCLLHTDYWKIYHVVREELMLLVCVGALKVAMSQHSWLYCGWYCCVTIPIFFADCHRFDYYLWKWCYQRFRSLVCQCTKQF